ncbi:MAG: transcriptional regulator [Candidatus Coatesbacteria bacterium]
MKALDFFSTHPVFTRGEFGKAVSAGRSDPEAAASAQLGRYLRAGRIGRVRRGVFFTPHPGDRADKGAVDFLLVASRCAPDAVLSHSSALEAHGYARTVFERVVFLTETKTKRFTFRRRPFTPVSPPAELRRGRQSFMFAEDVERQGLTCRVTSLERTAADVLDRPELAGGMEEAWAALAGVPLLDLAALMAYVRARGQATLAAMVGLFLEHHRKHFAVGEAALAELRAMRPRQPQYVDRAAGGKLVAGWNLIVPASLVEGDWEAVS